MPDRAICVLIVDDDDLARETLSAAIRGAGYSVATARNGREALSALEQTRPELVLLDLCMPDMDGQTFRQEQRRNRDWIRIPTVVMTGGPDETMLDPAVEETLQKPIQKDVVLELVRRHCSRGLGVA